MPGNKLFYEVEGYWVEPNVIILDSYIFFNILTT